MIQGVRRRERHGRDGMSSFLEFPVFFGSLAQVPWTEIRSLEGRDLGLISRSRIFAEKAAFLGKGRVGARVSRTPSCWRGNVCPAAPSGQRRNICPGSELAWKVTWWC